MTSAHGGLAIAHRITAPRKSGPVRAVIGQERDQDALSAHRVPFDHVEI
jgi:hypothetical protein